MMEIKDERDRSRDRDRDRSRRDRPSRFSDSSRDRSPDRCGGKERGGGGGGGGGMKSSSSNCRVYVSNIPYEYRWQDLKDLFRSQVGEVAFVELFVDENDKPRGCGIVEFSEPQSVKKCLECMHRFELKGRKLVIKEDFGNSRDKYGNLIGTKRRDRDEGRSRRDDRMYDNAPQGGMGGEPKWGNTYGLSPAFLDELKINTPLSTRVFVANLEYKVDKKKLKEVFRMAGKVQSVEMPLGKDGQSRGFAVIEFDHPVESVQAISMFHNQPLYERIMTVRMDRGSERDKLPEGLKSIGPGLGTNGEPLRDVARNLPSLSNNNQQQQQLNSGPGLLGAVPNLQQLGVNAAALNSLNNVSSALGNLSSTSQAVLQAANLAGVGNLSSNLLASGLGANELNLAANLVQNNPSLAALAASSSNLGNAGGGFNVNRNDPNVQSSFLSSQNSGGGGGVGGGGGGDRGGNGSTSNYSNSNLPSLTRSYQSYDTKPSFNFGGSDRDSRQGGGGGGGGGGGSGIGNLYGNMNNGSQMMRGNSSMHERKKLIISNVPPTATFKSMLEKCQQFGNVEHIDENNQGNFVVSFESAWDAETAMKNIDRYRIDGRTIEAHLI